jgi:hypothetical protein
MKATINQSGTLEIKTESVLETYAIMKWADDNFNRCSSKINGENFEINCGQGVIKTHKNSGNKSSDKQKFLDIYYEWLKIMSTDRMPLDEFIINHK